MITLDRVSKSYARFKAVLDVSFTISPGQCVGLLGPNGAGKTTTLRMITGYHPPTSGSVTVDGHDSVNDSQEVRRRIGYLPESTPLYPEMRVSTFLDHRARLFGLGRGARRVAIARVLERCWLTEVADRRIGHLSKGFRQRVGLASALVHDPAILILDEPSSGLDPSQIRETRGLIRELAQKRTVLVSSHILPEVEKTCDRVLVIARGCLRADGTPAALVERLGGGACIAEVRERDTDRALLALAGTGLDRVTRETPQIDEAGTPWVRLRIPSESDARERAAAALAGASVIARELRRDGATLEQVFLRLIEDDSAGVVGQSGSGAGVAA